MFILFIYSIIAESQEYQPQYLSLHQTDKGKSLMKALEERHSIRELSDRQMSIQCIANVLRAANGSNRVRKTKHTTPTALNRHEIEV